MDSPVLTLISTISGILVVLVESRVIMSPAAESSPAHERYISSPPPPTSPPPPAQPPTVPNYSTVIPRPHSKHTAVKRPPPPHRPKLNLGKEIGIVFCGAVVILQVGVLAFLLIRRRKIFKNPDRY